MCFFLFNQEHDLSMKSTNTYMYLQLLVVDIVYDQESIFNVTKHFAGMFRVNILKLGRYIYRPFIF